MGEPGRAVRPYTVFTPILASLTSKPRLPFLFSLGGWGGAGAEDLHQPRFHTASGFRGTRVGGSSSVRGLEAPGWEGAGAGAARQLRIHPSCQASLGHQVSLRRRERASPLYLPGPY